MDGPGVAKAGRASIPMRWTAFTYISPLLLECVRPILRSAPEILEHQPIADAIFALYLVDVKRFSEPNIRLSRHLTDEQIVRAWSKPFNFWRNDRKRILRYTRFDGTTGEVWPNLENALRTLIPNMPDQINPVRDFQFHALHKPDTRAFLFSITLLLGVVTRRKARSNS